MTMSSSLNLTLIFPIPIGTSNPFEYAADTMTNQMYPPFSSGFTARMAGLFTLLSMVIILSFMYLGLTLLDMRRRQKEIWVFRLVQRPAGKYIVLNQYILYPLCSILMAILWILLASHSFDVFGHKHDSPTNLLFWTPLLWVAVYIHLSCTTFAVLGGANLASTGRSKHHQSGSHFLSPLVANSSYIIAFPFMILAIAGVGIWTGYAWRDFSLKWAQCIAVLNLGAASFDGINIDQNIVAQATELASERIELYHKFVMTQKVSAAVYITSATALILVNTIGGLRLLLTLRSLGGSGSGSQLVDRNTPLVAPLTPLASTPAPLPTFGTVSLVLKRSETLQSDLFSKKVGQGSSGSGMTSTGPINPTLKRLEWDITLFFFSVVPACIAFIAYSAWLSENYTLVLTHGELLEFSQYGMIWIYSALVTCSTIAMSIKTSISIWCPQPYDGSMIHRGSTSSSGGSSTLKEKRRKGRKGGGKGERRCSVAKSILSITGEEGDEDEEKFDWNGNKRRWGSHSSSVPGNVNGLGLEGMKEEEEGEVDMTEVL